MILGVLWELSKLRRAAIFGGQLNTFMMILRTLGVISKSNIARSTTCMMYEGSYLLGASVAGSPSGSGESLQAKQEKLTEKGGGVKLGRGCENCQIPFDFDLCALCSDIPWGKLSSVFINTTRSWVGRHEKSLAVVVCWESFISLSSVIGSLTKE